MVEVTTFESFFQLKLLGDSFLKEPTVQVVKDMCGCIENFPIPVLQNLTEYILLPTISHLKHDVVSHDIKLHLLTVVDTILKRVRIMEMELFQNIYMALLQQIHAEKQPTIGHEELKLSVMCCLRHLFSRASMSVIESLYTRENSLKLSQSFYICLSVAKYEKYSALRISAIETLMTLSYLHDEADTNDSVLRSQIADIVMLYLPGMVRGMLDICHGNDIQNHKITLMAVRTLGRFIALVMEDLPDENTVASLMNKSNQAMMTNLSDPLKLQLQTGPERRIDEYLKTALRTQEWLDAASGKLSMPMKTLKSLTKHSHCKVREELAKTVCLLLIKCPKNMNTNFPELIDIIIILSEDDIDDVRKPASYFLDKVTHNIIANYQMRPIIALLEEKFYKLLIRFPRIMRSSNDASQLAYLNQMQGYLKILGKERLPKIMSSITYLRRLLLAFVYVLELDCQDVSVLGGNLLDTYEDTSQILMKTWKKFKFIRDSTVQNKLIFISQMLGELGDFNILVDGIFDLMLNMPNYQKELTLLLNWISMGQSTAYLSVYEQIINHYINCEISLVEVHDQIPLCEVQNNILQNCLLTEGLGIFAEVLQSDYQPFLLMTLYLIIERAGSKNYLTSLVGMHTLEKCANSLGYTNVQSLLRENMDYISYHITMKLRKLERNPGVLDVVKIVMKYSTLNVLPCLAEIVTEALSQLKAIHQQKNSSSILQVLYTFVVCMRQQLGNEKLQNSEENIGTMGNIAEVLDSLREYCDSKTFGNMIDDNLNTTEEELIHELNEEVFMRNNGEEKIDMKPPPYISLVEDVIKSSINFMPSKDVPETLLAMTIVRDGIKILAPWTDQLLPLIHDLWFPLVNRFKQENVLIMNQAWQLLSTVAQVAEDFIRTRTFDDIIPAISKFLETSASESHGKESPEVYKFTQMFKLQKNILSQFGLLAKYSKLNERQLWKLLCITEPYLSDHQHPVLQATCTQLYETIFHVNSDIVWIKCLSIQNSSERKNIIHGQSNVKNSKNGNKCENCHYFYQKNVEIILDYIDKMTTSSNN